MNLLQETLGQIEKAGLTTDQVAWVGSYDGRYAIDWDAFVSIARVDYYAGYGSQEIASDLVVVFTDGRWLERSEYDGSEGWDLKYTPIRSSQPLPFALVKDPAGWGNATLERIAKRSDGVDEEEEW